MKSIADLVEEKNEKYNLSFSSAKTMEQKEVSWLKCKNYLNSLGANYRNIVEEALLKNTFKVKKFKYLNNNIITLISKQFGHTILLEIVESLEGALKQVKYFAFNDLEMMSLERKIV